MKTITELENGSRKVAISFPENEPASRHRTKQEFWKDCDINHIMKKYRKTGILGDPLSYREGMYGDFSSGEDFASMMRKVADVQSIFAELPSHVRTRFANDPSRLIEFLVDPKNDEEAIKMGLKLKPAPAPAPAQPAGTGTASAPAPATGAAAPASGTAPLPAAGTPST